MQQAGAGYPQVKDGFFRLPERPGWGVELDEAFLAEHPPLREDGMIRDGGLDMFRSENWNLRGQPKTSSLSGT